MADINDRIRRSSAQAAATAPSPERERPAREAPEPAFLNLVELLFFAYRDFTREPDKILADFGFGRAHHRVLHFVNRYPGMRVADLLDILKITKQSLGRVLKQLVDEGFILQEAGKNDRRERRLYPTQSGRELAEQLVAPQIKRLTRAIEASGQEARTCITTFLGSMISETDRAGMEKLLGAGKPEDAAGATPTKQDRRAR